MTEHELPGGAETSPALVSVRNLAVRLGDDGRTLLEDISLEVTPGARLGIIGESGSGKSLTAHAITGLLPERMHVRGHIAYRDDELLAVADFVPANERAWRSVRGRRIATVFQEPLTALDPLMRVERQIAGPLRLHHGLVGAPARQRTIELLDQVQLPRGRRVLRAYPHELSGGQRQRVAIAMALACSPELLIADEPTTALDVTVQAQVVRLLRDLVTELGMALIFITHDLPLIARIAEDLVVMRKGRVVETGRVTDIIAAPQHEYTRQLMRAATEVSRVPYREGA